MSDTTAFGGFRTLSLVEAAALSPKGWTTWLIRDEPLIDIAVRQRIHLRFGPDICLGALDRMPDERLVRITEITEAQRKQVRAVLAFWREQDRLRTEAEERTVFWNDGDYGSEWITPQELAKRLSSRQT